MALLDGQPIDSPVQYLTVYGHIPSKKNSRRIVHVMRKLKNGTRKRCPMSLPSEAYERWNAEYKIVFRNSFNPIGVFCLRLDLYRKKLETNNDSDNVLSSVLDTLKDAGVIVDDNDFYARQKMVFTHKGKERKTMITLTPLEV